MEEEEWRKEEEKEKGETREQEERRESRKGGKEIDKSRLTEGKTNGRGEIKKLGGLTRRR